MPIIIGVRFPSNSKVYYFDPKGVQYKNGEGVVVETARGVELGKVVHENDDIASYTAELKPVLRKATEQDFKRVEEIAKKKEFALKVISEKVKKHELSMKVLDCEYSFDLQKVIFFFTAEGRVDFRELVKDLASVLHVRIELRQVYERDDIKIRGAMSPCGRPCCCANHLKDFEKVSIKMAKTQGLALSSAKISGTCGKLMCCLKYENDYYAETAKKMPKYGATVKTPDGLGFVVGVNLLKQTVKAKVDLEDGGFEVKEFDLEAIQLKKGGVVADEIKDDDNE